jgi:hypothetical protein
MEEGSSEQPKLKQWVDAMLKLPFGKYEEVPVSIRDGPSHIRAYLRSIRHALDTTVYGHDTTKNDIMQLVSQWISNPQSMSQVLGIAGPPGTGKTTLVRHGIAKALGRPFVQISLGGATDASTLSGHSYTYEGATWGRIAANLMQTRCMNPVIFFDEVDKVSDTQAGQEIIGLLIHLTDPTQNDEFMDRYFDGVPLDLSRALMIFSFNDVEALNAARERRCSPDPALLRHGGGRAQPQARAAGAEPAPQRAAADGGAARGGQAAALPAQGRAQVPAAPHASRHRPTAAALRGAAAAGTVQRAATRPVHLTWRPLLSAAYRNRWSH